MPALLCCLLGSAPQSDEKGPVILTMMASPQELMRLGVSWRVTECCGWTGIWTRRPGTQVFDASWKHTNGTVVKGVVTLVSWNKRTQEVVLDRPGVGTYRATLQPATGTLVQGRTSWYPAGATWSATLWTDNDAKGPVRLPTR